MSNETRKMRRRREREEGAARNSEAGPSNAGPSTSTSGEPSASGAVVDVADSSSTFAGADFIPFELSEDEEEEERTEDDPFPVREWDKGKGKARERETDREQTESARKRKADDTEYSRDDRSHYQRQLGESSQRKAPWVVGANLEDCTNVAQLYVCFLTVKLREVLVLNIQRVIVYIQNASRSGSVRALYLAHTR